MTAATQKTTKTDAQLKAKLTTSADGTVSSNGVKIGKEAKVSSNGRAKAELNGLAAQHPEWQGKTCNFRKDGSLTAMQISILKALAKYAGPVSADEIAKKVGQDKWPKLVRWAVGKIKDEGRCPFSLLARKLVRQHTEEEGQGRAQHSYSITALGRKIAEKS
jgi:hypothetical protein